MQNKSISKNTVYLTIRMVVLMVINFYTSRVILDKLGVEDYGVYNIVFSLAIVFSFFGSSLTNATQRFVTIELGKNNQKRANQIINLHFEVYAIIAFLCVIVAEVVGIYFIQNKINIPIERINASIWVFQFALLSIVFQMITIPFEACVIAHEDMNIYSFMGIFEGGMRLLIAFLISWMSYDRLIIYASLMCLVTGMTQTGYSIYAFRHYKECFLRFFWNVSFLKESFSFVGWNVVGTARSAIITQGMDLVLNIFLGPIANAARGVTNQVSGAIFKFSSNVLVAAQPQLVKSFASGDNKRLNTLFFKTSLFSYYVLWVLICPLLFNLDSLLSIWLKDVPTWTAGFLFWHLWTSLVYVLTRPLWSIIIAVGTLRKYIIVDFITSILSIPLAVFVLKWGLNPVYVYVGCLAVQIINTYAQLKVVNEYICFGMTTYFKKVIIRVAIITIVTCPITWLLSVSITLKGIYGLLFSYALGLVIVGVMILLAGIEKDDRNYIIGIIKYRFSDRKKKCVQDCMGEPNL